jgi:uncharacterized protein (TIGR00251 family)
VSALLRVRVSPKGSADAVLGWHGDELRVKVTAAPTDGKANDAVCALIGAELGIRKSAVSVKRGHASRSKTLEIDGLADAELSRVFPR